MIPDEVDLANADSVAEWLNHSAPWQQHHAPNLYICPLCSAAIPSGWFDPTEEISHIDAHISHHWHTIRAFEMLANRIDTHFHTPNVLA